MGLRRTKERKWVASASVRSPLRRDHHRRGNQCDRRPRHVRPAHRRLHALRARRLLPRYVYVRVFAHQFREGRDPLRHCIAAAASYESGVLLGGVPALGTFAVATALGVTPSTAADIALWVTVIVLGSIAYLAARWAVLARSRGPRRVRSGRDARHPHGRLEVPAALSLVHLATRTHGSPCSTEPLSLTAWAPARRCHPPV